MGESQSRWGKGGKERAAAAAAAAGCIKSEAGKKQVTRGISWSAARCGRQAGIISFRPSVHIASSSFLIGSAFLPKESADSGAELSKNDGGTSRAIVTGTGSRAGERGRQPVQIPGGYERRTDYGGWYRAAMTRQ